MAHTEAGREEHRLGFYSCHHHQGNDTVILCKLEHVLLAVCVCVWPQLNAWDCKMIEEPAYEERLEGFSEAKQLLLCSPSSVDSILPILHNAVFFMLMVPVAS